MGFPRLCLAVLIWAICTWTVLGDCPFPKRGLSNGRIVFQEPHHVNWTVAQENYLLRFKCSPGYFLKGVTAILCISDKWTDRMPSCIKMQCGDPPTVPNGVYQLKSGVNSELFVGSTATYSCNNGYELEESSNSVLTCHLFDDINEAQWKGVVPVCKKKESCPDPGKSVDGQRWVRRSKTGVPLMEGRVDKCCFVGDVLSFACNEDFEMVGEEQIECLSEGRWSAARPLCRPTDDHCDLPPPIAHGVAKGSKDGDFYRPYDEVEIMCQPGYRYSGESQYVMCEEETGWEAEFEGCAEFTCDLPEPLANGRIPEIETTNTTSFPFNFELTYICDKGYRLIGDSWRFCDSKGWSGKNPYCTEIQCPYPGVPENGKRSGSNFTIGQRVVFECFTGYSLIGSFERYCMPNGQWNGELARCDHKDNYCPNPGVPVKGMKNSSDYELGDKVLFRCHFGFTLVGTNVRECLPSREWSGEEVRCLGPHDFDNSAQVGEILKAAMDEKEAEQKRKLEEYNEALFDGFRNGTYMQRGRILELSFPGRLIFYFAFDVSGSVRKHNFRKSVAFAKAIVSKVGISPHGARAGALTFSSTSDVAFLPLQFDTTEGVLQALDAINYTGGGTSATSALAHIREDLIPLTNEVLNRKGFKSVKSVIFILTDGKSNMGGDPEEEGRLLKKAGVEIYCIGITNTVHQDSLYKIASGQDGQHVFILERYDVLSFLIQEITNGTVDYSKCGLGLEKLGKQASGGKIVGGRQAVKPWPWMAALNFKSAKISSEVQCGGSIIHESYILTAAHCLYSEKYNSFILRDAKDIIVRLGLINVMNQSSMQSFEVNAFYKHPAYQPGSYDYDIALLRLKRPIEYSNLIRPICLPPINLPADTRLYKPNELSVAIGWGHSGIVKAGPQPDTRSEDDLKEIILPIQTPDRCVQSIQDHSMDPRLFTDRMFCVGDGMGGNDTCMGDSGGPLMQSQLNEDGYTYWTQVGIVSWGIGCGLRNTYGYYTNVTSVHDWVRSLLPMPGQQAEPQD